MATKATDTNTAVAISSQGQNIDISNGYTSVRGNDLETQKKVYNAVNNAAPLAEHLNEEIHVSDLIIQAVVTEPDEQTGQVDEYLRTTFISPDGTAISSGSQGVSNAVRNLLAIFGTPDTWGAEGLTVKVTEKRGNKGYKFYSVEVV